MNYAIYNPSGEILRTVNCSPSQAEYQAEDGELLLEVSMYVVDDLYYIMDGVAALKEAVPVVPEVAGLDVTLTGIPSGMLVSVEGESLVADGEPVDLDFDEAGTYTIHLSGSVGYLDTSLEVTVG